jgi:hypothetical protein
MTRPTRRPVTRTNPRQAVSRSTGDSLQRELRGIIRALQRVHARIQKAQRRG